jgi:hypothetical protein
MQRMSWEVDTCWAGKQIPSLLIAQQFGSIFGQFNQSHTLENYSSQIHLNVILPSKSPAILNLAQRLSSWPES